MMLEGVSLRVGSSMLPNKRILAHHCILVQLVDFGRQGWHENCYIVFLVARVEYSHTNRSAGLNIYLTTHNGYRKFDFIRLIIIASQADIIFVENSEYLRNIVKLQGFFALLGCNNPFKLVSAIWRLYLNEIKTVELFVVGYDILNGFNSTLVDL